MKYINSILIITVLLTQTASSNTKINASFSCNKATQPIEHAICSDESLARLDKEMAQVYKNKRKSSSPDEINTLKKEQKKWLRKRVANCKITKSNYKDTPIINCLINSYKKRIDEIQNGKNNKFTFYKESLKKNQFSISDRLKWKKIAKWPDSCHFDRLKYMSNAGLEFYNIDDNTYILEVMCDRYAYQSEYKLYSIVDLPNKVNATALKIPQLKFKNGKWHSFQSNKIIGHFQYYKKDNTLLNIHKYSGAGQCGHSATYSISIKNNLPVVTFDKAWGNDDCKKKMSEDDWPEIKITEIK